MGERLSRNERKFLTAIGSRPQPSTSADVDLRNMFGQPWSIGAFYVMAARLEDRGLIASRAVRETRLRIYYHLTDLGLRALRPSLSQGSGR